ncbi:hypothetical protein [Saccharibacillus sacchari]|uniref:Uncharacterized protein n=1 Tax=Saccharibacillus sacchari TaxID=456493 RepID=A0ACC6PG84_9BACL
MSDLNQIGNIGEASGDKRIKLSIPVGMLLENCRSGGFSDDEIADMLNARDYSKLPERVREPEMEFAERFATAEEMGEDWERALREGYTFKFLHVGALRRLLLFRHGLVVERDYVQDELDLRGVPLTTEEAEQLQATIVRQWAVEPEQGEGAKPGTYRIGLKFRD